MTNEEAIKVLKANYPDACFGQLREAVDAAIEALTKEAWKEEHPVSPLLQSSKQDADDLISRKQAIDAILAVTGNSSVRELYEHVQEHGLSDMWSGGVNAAIDIIIAVPPVQPEPCGDVVSRNAIVQKLNEMDRYVSTELRLCDTDKKFPQNEVFIVDDVYEEIVEQLPSAQPTLYGYSIDHLALIAHVMEKEGVSPEEAVRFFKDTQRICQMLVDEIQKQVEGMFESCVT